MQESIQINNFKKFGNDGSAHFKSKKGDFNVTNFQPLGSKAVTSRIHGATSLYVKS
jgi:hypothetical protein